MSVEKSSLRLELKDELKKLNVENCLIKSQQISTHLQTLIDLTFPKQESLNIAAFAPIEYEPLWFIALKSDWAEKQKWFLPRFSWKDSERKLNFTRVSWPEVVANKWGDGAVKFFEQTQVTVPIFDLILVPALALTEAGERLGKGAGYYDRFLVKQTGLKCGLIFKEQLLKKIINEDHDQKVDFIVTDKEFFKRRGK